MTHLHIPDGVLPAWLWLGGAGVAAALIALAARIASGRDFRRRLPLLSIAAAFMVVSMSVPVIPAVYNVQLAAVVGIILGPALGVIAAFIVNLLLALVGHGGITIVGLNTLILGGEMLAAWVLFHLLRVALAPGVAGGVAAFLAMATGAGIMIGVVALGSLQTGQIHAEHVTVVGEPGHQAGERVERTATFGHENLSVRRFGALVVGLGVVGWLLEAVITGIIVRFASRVKPDLVGLAVAHEPV